MNSAEQSPIKGSRVSIEDSTQRSVLPEWETIRLSLQTLREEPSLAQSSCDDRPQYVGFGQWLYGLPR